VTNLPALAWWKARHQRAGGRTLAAPGLLALPLALSRAQVSTSSTALGADGVTWGEFGADVPRFNGVARRLLIEGQRTNSVRNPRMEGAVAGSPGTMPTHMAAANAGREIVGTGVESGIPFIDVRYTGSPADYFDMNFDTANVVYNSPDTATGSVYLRLMGGSFTNISAPSFGIYGVLFGFVDNPVTSIAGLTNAPLITQRFTATQSFVGTITQLSPRLSFIGDGGAIDFTIRIGGIQVEAVGAFASSLILPPVSAPAASTRGADLLSATLASLGISANGASTVLWSGMIPHEAGALSMDLIDVDDGTASNRLVLYVSAGTKKVRVLRALAGSTSVGILGSYVPGTPFRAGISLDGAGRLAGSFDGGTVAAVTGGPIAGLTTLRIANNATSTAPLSGEVGGLLVLPLALSDADLQARVAALPL